MKNYVISAVNIISGGPLTVLNSLLVSLSKEQTKNVQYFVLTSFANVINKEVQNNSSFLIIEMPWACKNIFTRLFFEYAYLYFWSRTKSIYLWLSLNDVTPNVVAEHRVTYFHNPSPFMPFKRMLVKNSLFVLYGLLYNLVYFINIKKNDFVVVQQKWMAHIVSRRYHPKCVLTALPVQNSNTEISVRSKNKISTETLFCFPAFPRFFKNYEVIGEAVILLENMGYAKFSVIFTLTGAENKYSSMIKRKYGHLAHIQFAGLLNRLEMDSLYSQADVLIFPSLLETWGLPISEFKVYGKPMLVAECPYANETVGRYPWVSFFDPLSAQELASLMAKIIDKTIVYATSNVDEAYDCNDFDSLAAKVLAL